MVFLAAAMMLAQTGLPFAVELKSGPSTGYQWQIPSAPDGIQLLDSEYRPAPNAQIGDPATQVFHFRASKAGHYSLRFVLKRAWEKEPIREAVIDVDVK
jgi:predicted secreted protein